MNTNLKRYLNTFTWSMALYVVTIIGSIILLENIHHIFWRSLLALSPMLPVIFLLKAFLSFLQNLDELQQRIHFMAIGFAAGTTSLLTFMYGFLENAGLPHISLIYVFPLMIMLWGLGVAFFSRQY